MIATRRRRPRLTPDQYDGLVYRWNSLRPSERQAHRTTCEQECHDWVEASFSDPHQPTYVCRRCMKYDARTM
jgi:hypothetical protein